MSEQMITVIDKCGTRDIRMPISDEPCAPLAHPSPSVQYTRCDTRGNVWGYDYGEREERGLGWRMGAL